MNNNISLRIAFLSILLCFTIMHISSIAMANVPTQVGTEMPITNTQTDAMSYKDLQNENNAVYESIKNAIFKEAFKETGGVPKSVLSDYQMLREDAQISDTKVKSPLLQSSRGKDYWGKSMSDDDIVVGGDNFTDSALMERRAEKRTNVLVGIFFALVVVIFIAEVVYFVNRKTH